MSLNSMKPITADFAAEDDKLDLYLQQQMLPPLNYDQIESKMEQDKHTDLSIDLTEMDFTQQSFFDSNSIIDQEVYQDISMTPQKLQPIGSNNSIEGKVESCGYSMVAGVPSLPSSLANSKRKTANFGGFRLPRYPNQKIKSSIQRQGPPKSRTGSSNKKSRIYSSQEYDGKYANESFERGSNMQTPVSKNNKNCISTTNENQYEAYYGRNPFADLSNTQNQLNPILREHSRIYSHYKDKMYDRTMVETITDTSLDLRPIHPDSPNSKNPLRNLISTESDLETVRPSSSLKMPKKDNNEIVHFDEPPSPAKRFQNLQENKKENEANKLPISRVYYTMTGEDGTKEIFETQEALQQAISRQSSSILFRNSKKSPVERLPPKRIVDSKHKLQNLSHPPIIPSDESTQPSSINHLTSALSKPSIQRANKNKCAYIFLNGTLTDEGRVKISSKYQVSIVPGS